MGDNAEDKGITTMTITRSDESHINDGMLCNSTDPVALIQREVATES